MDPSEVAKRYQQQADVLSHFLEKIKANPDHYTKEELHCAICVIAEQYYKLLISLAYYTPLLENYNVKMHKVSPAIEKPKSQFPEPPYEKDFFNRKD